MSDLIPNDLSLDTYDADRIAWLPQAVPIGA